MMQPCAGLPWLPEDDPLEAAVRNVNRAAVSLQVLSETAGALLAAGDDLDLGSC